MSRFALAASGDGAAQLLHGIFGIIAAIAASLIAYRMGYSKYVVILSAIFFLAIRVVIWEMGTVEVDVALAAVTTLAVLVYLTWRDQPNWGLGVVFGLLIGCAILFKCYGVVFAVALGPIILMDIIRGRISIQKIAVGSLVAVLATSFHFGRNYVLTSNPVFPIYNKFFKPEAMEQMNSAAGAYGTGRGIIDLFITPVTMFTSPMAYFDGMIFGSPYLLVLAPLILLDWEKARKWAPIVLISSSYFVLWFYVGGHQVPFSCQYDVFGSSRCCGS